MNKIKRAYRAIVHSVIRRYLIWCAGAFHTGHYGLYGHYVVLMTDAEYSLWKTGKRPGLVNIYKGDDAFFLALPDFSNLETSPTIWLGRETVAQLFADNARNQEDESIFWEAVDGQIVWRNVKAHAEALRGEKMRAG